MPAMINDLYTLESVLRSELTVRFFDLLHLLRRYS